MVKEPKQTLALKPELRQELKNPLGTLMKGTPKETMRQLAKLISEEKPKRIISVGDVVSRNMLQQGLRPSIVIVDGKVMREKTQQVVARTKKKVVIQNPAGTITPEAWVAVKKALRQKMGTLIMIEGEEDLLTLVAVLEAPKGSFVVYGQPNEGVVAVKVNETAKNKAWAIVEGMALLPKS